MGRAREAVFAFYEEHDHRPRNRDMAGLTFWLRTAASLTLQRFCDELGLPPGRRTKHTLKTCKQVVTAFYEQHKRRPTIVEMSPVDQWLRSHAGTTLQKLGDELGFPPRGHRTLESCRMGLRSFYEKHGRRPTVIEEPRLNAWLKRNTEYSLGVLCDEMGLLGRSYAKRTLENCQKEVRAFWERCGRRPRVKDLVNTHRWLYNHGSSLRKLCDDLDLPHRPPSKREIQGIYQMGRTSDSCREELLNFCKKHGRPPAPRDVPKVYQWLHRRGIPWKRFCEEAALPSRKKGRPRSYGRGAAIPFVKNGRVEPLR